MFALSVLLFGVFQRCVARYSRYGWCVMLCCLASLTYVWSPRVPSVESHCVALRASDSSSLHVYPCFLIYGATRIYCHHCCTSLRTERYAKHGVSYMSRSVVRSTPPACQPEGLQTWPRGECITQPGTLGAKRHALREEFRTESLTGHTKDWAEVERSGTTNTPIRGFVRFREEGRGARLAAIWGKYPGFKK